ncbi:MAG: hypothetical protein ABIO70_19085 [Pseudomonadota bacterium]
MLTVHRSAALTPYGAPDRIEPESEVEPEVEPESEVEPERESDVESEPDQVSTPVYEPGPPWPSQAEKPYTDSPKTYLIG